MKDVTLVEPPADKYGKCPQKKKQLPESRIVIVRQRARVPARGKATHSLLDIRLLVIRNDVEPRRGKVEFFAARHPVQRARRVVGRARNGPPTAIRAPRPDAASP